MASAAPGAADEVPVAVLILTLNEEMNIRRCIEALERFAEIVVLDSFSDDATVETARATGASVYQRRFDDFASQRNFALDNFDFSQQWVLHLDADEVIPAESVDEIARAIKDPRFDAYEMAPKLIFKERWLRFSSMYPSYQVRLGRRDVLRFRQVGHGQREDLQRSRVGTLKVPYLHYGFSKGIAYWKERHERYARDEALENLRLREQGLADWRSAVTIQDSTRRRRGLKHLSVRLPFRPAFRFLYMYLLRLGFLDGLPGLEYCRLMRWYEGRIVVQLRTTTTVPSTSIRS